jgi:hypothetical protein
MSRRFGPKVADHPSIGKTCRACEVPFKAGDYTTLVMLGPGDDHEARARRDAGRPYTAVAIEVHWECAGSEYRDEPCTPESCPYGHGPVSHWDDLKRT